jgi:hypothetical protein
LFEERDGVTTMTINVLHEKKEHRDAHVVSEMESGMEVSMNQLEDVVAEMRQVV